MKKTLQHLSWFILGIVLLGCSANRVKAPVEKFYVAAYVWPSCHDEQRSREAFWTQGIGEWEVIQKGNPRFEGHYQPRIPLWGYGMDNSPAVIERNIRAAIDHGVNVFIYDWYWYGGKPLLEESVNSFLKSPNKDLMKFYLMWANHDAEGNRWNRYRYEKDTVLWTGVVTRPEFNDIVERVINNYFTESNYFKIDDKPVFSIYSVEDLVKSFGSLTGTKEALDYFRQKVTQKGFPGLHLQVIGNVENNEPALLRGDLKEGKTVKEIIDYLGINSVTNYNWVLNNAVREDYIEWAERAMKLINRWDSTLDIPYIPDVTIGWDSSPRFANKKKEDIIHLNNTPTSFATYLQRAKEFVRARPEQPQMIIVNSWNEWVEGSYLEPDTQWGYGYLEAVRDVMDGKYDRYVRP